MIRTTNRVINISFILLFIINILFAKEYLIFSPNSLLEAGVEISNIYNDESKDYFLSTELIITDTLQTPINEYISYRIDGDSNIKYLLILGDENSFPSPSNSVICQGISQDYPTDDFFSLGEEQRPRLGTGRIPASNINEALNYVDKLKSYLDNPMSGPWKSTILLVSDDEVKNDDDINNEVLHTKYSDDIYQLLSDLTFIKTLYGPMYQSTSNEEGRRLPELTNDIISYINKGAAIINYIGHGDPEKWSAEHIIEKNRDLNLIDIQDNKLPIWVAGTCYFGRYDGVNSMSEALLFDSNSAISIIGATRAIGSNINKSFLEIFYTEIQDYILNINNNDILRLGDVFLKAKQELSDNMYSSGCDGGYLFDILGDPSIPLPFAKLNQSIFDFEPSIELLKNIDINPENPDDYSFIQITSEKNEISLLFQDEDDINETINLTFDYTPDIYFESEFSGSTCYTPPLDLISSESILMKYYSEENNNSYIAYSEPIYIDNISNEFYNEKNDLTGPQISFWLGENEILNNSHFSSSNNIEIKISDPLGINISSGIGHQNKFWFDTNQVNIVDYSEIIFTNNCSEIRFPISLNIAEGNFLYVEAWDNANNKSVDSLKLSIELNENYNNIINVYNFPNPFSDRTFFTYQIVDFPNHNVYTNLTIYSQNGIIIKKITDFQLNNFISIEWDGKDGNNNLVSNGSYIYTIEIKLNNRIYKKSGALSIIR